VTLEATATSFKEFVWRVGDGWSPVPRS